MIKKISSFFVDLHTWQIMLLSMLGAVFITDLVTALFSLWLWNTIRFDLMALGTLNALLVPALTVPFIIRIIRKMVKLEEQTQAQHEHMQGLEERKNHELARQKYAYEALHNQRLNDQALYEATQKQSRELALIGNIRNAMAQELELPALLHSVVESVASSFGYTQVSLYLLEGDMLTLQHQVGYEHPYEKIALLEGVIGRAARTGQAIYLEDVNADPEYRKAVDDVTSEICVPFFDIGQVVGILNVESIQGVKLTETEYQLLVTLSEHLGLAIGRARLYADIQRRNHILSALEKSTLVLMKKLDLNETLQTILLQAAQLLKTPHAYIYLVEPDEKEIKTILGMGIFSDSIGKKLNPNEGLAGKIWQSGETLNIADYRQWDGRSAQFEAIPFHAVVGVPLRANEHIVGVLGLAHMEPNITFSSGDVDLISRFADLASVAFDNARLYTVNQMELIVRRQLGQALRKREAILEAVTFAAEKFIQSSNWRENINPILERLGITLNATHAYLSEHHLSKAGEQVVSMRYEWTAPGHQSDLGNEEFQNGPLFEAGFENYYETLARGDIFIGNSSTFSTTEKEHFESLGIKALLEVPLFVGGGWWGTIGFDDFEEAREWSNAEVDALKIAAGILSAAIQRQEVDSAVRESERVYRQAIETAGAVPYYQEYKHDKYEFIGEGIQALTGYSAQEMSASLWDSIVKEAKIFGDLENYSLNDAAELVREGRYKNWKCDYRITTRDGQTRWIADSAIELFDETGYSYASIGIMQDITERKQIEASLRHRESILKAITFSAEQFLKTSNWIENINTVLERLGREFNTSHAYLFERHEKANHGIVNSLRYEWTAPGQTPDINDPQYQNVPSESIAQKRYYEVLDSGEPFVGSTSYFTKEEMEDSLQRGIKALLEMRIVVDGKTWGTIGFDEMVHDREWTAVEVDVIRIAANVLGAAIKRQKDEETLQLELNQRKQLIEELELKNRELNDFTYTVSHDLKSPLVTINGFLGYLDKDIQAGKTDRTQNDIQRIQEAVKRMQQLLNELLELSRIGRMINKPEIVPFDELVREALDIVHGRLEAHNITVHAQPNLPAIYGDKPRLVEALQNLLDNAAKYIGDQPDPVIEIGSETGAKGETIFFIRDNGMGIEPQYHERIFGLFNKLDAKSEGTGIGLALVKKIIEVHGGRIWVISEIGKGSTFYFTLK